MAYTIKGKVFKVESPQQLTDKLKKQVLILHVPNDKNPKYDDYISFEAINGTCDKLSSLKEGQEVEVEFFVSGRKYEKNGDVRFFTSLRVWNVNLLTGSSAVPNEITQDSLNDAIPPESNISSPPKEEKPPQNFDDDDLPF